MKSPRNGENAIPTRRSAAEFLQVGAALAALAALFAGGYWVYTSVVGRVFFQAQGAPVLPVGLALTLAVLGGAASFFSPCSLVITPAFLTYFVGAGSSGAIAPDGRRPFAAALLIAAGIFGFYAVAGGLVSTIGAVVYNFLIYLIPLVGALFVLLGGVMLVGRGAGLAWAAPYLPGRRYYERLLHDTERKSWRELVGFGVAYGVASHSCTLPIFLGIMMLPLAAGNYWLASLAVLLYGSALAGLMLIMLILGQPAVLAMRRLTGSYLQYVVGGLFLVTGGYLIHYFMVNYGFTVSF